LDAAHRHHEGCAGFVITLGIDIGTTHTKVLAIDAQSGRTIALEAVPTPVHRDRDGEVHRPAEVLDVVLDLLRRVAAVLPAGTEVTALSAASVGEEVVLIGGDGGPVGDAIAWYDPRGVEEAGAYLHGAGRTVALTRRWPPDPTFSLFKLQWLRQHRPAQYAAAVAWTDLGDYVLHGLGADVVMDWSHASRAGAFDLVQHRWDRESIVAAGLDISFPRLVPSGTAIGTMAPSVARDTGLPPGMAIVAGGHDHLVAAFGAGVRSTDELFISAGTSEAHLALLESPLEGAAGAGIDQGRYLDDRTFYAHVNIHSGLFFQQWRDLLYPGVDEAVMYAELEAVAAAGVTFEVTDDNRLGRLDGMPSDANRAVLMRAILDGLARRSAAIIDRLERAAGKPYELVLVAGHPTRVPLWRALRRAAYARPMASVEEPEIAAFGAAVLAAHATAGLAAARLVAGRSAWHDEPGPPSGPTRA
jgi:sugar (pentulose or hexulose) kinase